MTLRPNTIYFNPPDKEVGSYQGVFHLIDHSAARYARTPIDFFFRSIAQDLEEKAICIVLSGTEIPPIRPIAEQAGSNYRKLDNSR